MAAADGKAQRQTRQQGERAGMRAAIRAMLESMNDRVHARFFHVRARLHHAVDGTYLHQQRRRNGNGGRGQRMRNRRRNGGKQHGHDGQPDLQRLSFHRYQHAGIITRKAHVQPVDSIFELVSLISSGYIGAIQLFFRSLL